MSEDLLVLVVSVLFTAATAFFAYHFARQAADDRKLGNPYWGWIIAFCAMLIGTEIFAGVALSRIPRDEDLRYALIWTFLGGLLAALAFGLWMRRLRRVDLLLGLLASFAIALSAIVWWYQLL